MIMIPRYVLGGAASFSVATVFISSFLITKSLYLVFLALCAAYSYSYLDNAEHKIHDGRMWPWFQRLRIWKNLLLYFPARIECEQPFFPGGPLSASPLDPTTTTPSSVRPRHDADVTNEFLEAHPYRYVLAMHPHGAYTVNHALTMTDGAGFLSNMCPLPRRDLVASVLFR